VLPVWELNFGNMPQSTQRNATEKVRTIPTIRERRGIIHGPAENLPPELRTGIQKVAKWICRTLNLDGYVRVDFRLSADNVPYFLEANPNPEIARSQEFAHAADQDGVAYSELLRRILALGMKRANGVRAVG
jgi:D-alanine-D-alanine ligase